MSANFSDTRSQHTLKYKKEGDFGKERPYASPVFYEDSKKIFKGTCEKCAFNIGNHELNCTSQEARINKIANRYLSQE